MIQSEPVTASAAPSFTTFHRAGPSSSSQLFPFFFAHASRLVPSNRTMAPFGAFAPRDGGVRVTWCSENVLSPFFPANSFFWIAAVQPSPLKETTASEDEPSKVATRLFAVSKDDSKIARYLPSP